MVSTLHITLTNNQPSPSPQWLGRSASCEETNLLGISSTLTATSKTTSLSTSSVLRPQAPGAGVLGLPSSTHNLVAPTPYSPSVSSKAQSWSPVRLKTKPLPDFLKRLNQESVHAGSPGAPQAKDARCRAAAPQGAGRPSSTTSTVEGQVPATLAARWSPAASGDSSKPKLSPRADRKVLGIPISSVAVSSASEAAPFNAARGKAASATQGHWRSLSDGSPSRSRREVSPATINDPLLKPAAGSTAVPQEACPRIQDVSPSASGQLGDTQDSGRRPSLGSASKESPTAPRKQLLGDTAWFSPSSRSATMPALRTAASAPWQQRPNRLSSASLQRFEDSVHSGGGREGVGGGVMEDGGRHTRVAPTSSAHRKANSLPGYSRGGSNLQPSFREAFNTSKSPTPPSRTNDAPAAPPRGPTSPRAATKAVGVPSVLPQQQRHKQKQQHQQQQHQQKQQHPQQQQQQKQNQQQSSNNLQQYQKQHQQQLQQQLRQKQMEQQLQQQQFWQQHQQQQRMHETYRQNAQQQGKSQRQPKLPQHGLAPPVSQDRQPPPSQEPSPPKPVPSTPEKKSKISILSGIFRRRKKGSSNSSSSSVSSTDSEEPPQRRSFLRRRSKKKERKDPLPPPPPIPPAEERLGRTFGDFHDGNNLRRPGDSSYRRVRVVPAGTGSLGKETQPLGIPMLAPQPGKLNRLGVSASHDSLPLSLGSWTGGGSHASLGYHSGGGMGTRSSSTDTISKKERREALKARVERLRDRTRDTSSDDEKASVSSHSMYGSESSLSKNGSISRRSRAARTERFLRRKSHELETLRNETEKDRRNREAVQARIEEIQRVREFEAKRNKLNEERKSQSVPKTKSRWCAKLVYQESSEYESSVLLRTPSVSPVASPHMKAKLNGHAKDGVVLRNKPVSSSVAVSLAVPSVTPSRRSFQDHDSPVHNTLRGHRSASYDSNINRNSFVMQQSAGPAPSGVPRTNRSGLIPPTPPPRDKSRILSPGDGRPMSFSFESLNQEAQRPNSSQSSMSNFTKGSSPSPSVRSVPAYLGPRSNTQAPGPSPMLLPSRRSFSELELSQQQQTQAKSGFPASPSRPAPPGYPNSHYTYTDEPPRPAPQNHYYRPQHQQQPNEQMQYYTDESPQHTKIVPISSVPASPSSDYSSYMSDNSIRLQQANTAWRQKEQEIKNKISVSPSTAPPAISDSSPCNSPKPENGAASSPVRQMQQQDEGIYATIETKKSRPAPITLNQAESFSSLSGQSDVSSPPPRGPDSDSSQGSLARDKKKLAQNRPLSMVLEKVECGEKETPPTTPKGRPQPPVRGTWQSATSGREITNRKKFEEIVKHKVDVKAEKSISQKEVEDMFKKEKEKLQSSKCSNFEEALKELEEIYASLRLDSEDLLDGAERRDLPVQHQEMWAKKAKKYNDQKDVVSEGDSLLKDSGRTRSLSGRRSGVPDVKGDDMHFRRCQQSTRNQPDVQKALQMTGSYLLVSPAHVTPSELDQDLPKDPMMLGEPDVVYDDVLYRNIKQANSIKVIDPQPPFGIPLGPTTQASSSDYLHVTPKENYRPTMTTRKQPDITMDDLAFRNLRRDKGNKEVNTSELDELLCEARTGSPRRRTVRSASADRAQSKRGDRDRELKHHTSRQGRHQNDTQRVGGRTDSEAMAGLNSVSSRHNPSWLERAHLVDPKWDMSTNNLSTSTETLTELSSTRAVSQPDIRQAIIREARGSKGGPLELAGGGLHHITATSLATPIPVTLATITVPRLVKVHTAHSAPASPVILEAMPYKPLDSIFNNKAKPFYLGNADTDQQDDKQEDQEQLHKEKQQQQQPKQQQQEPVDIAKLDALISTLSKIDANEVSDSSDTSSKRRPLNHPPTKTAMKELKISELALENVPEPQTVASGHSRKSSVDYEYNSAKANVKKAIRLSMALESYNSEGKEVCSRRRSAVDLPVRESPPSHGDSSISSTNTLSLLNHNPASDGGGGSVAVPRAPSQTAAPQAVPAKASTCTDRVESMVVVSQQVHGRARRSRSVPTSPRTVDTAPLLSKTFAKPLINESEVSTDGEVECSQEHEGARPSGVSTSLALSGQGGDTLAEILSPPSSSTVTPDVGQSLSKRHTSSNQSTLIACETLAASQSLPSQDDCAHENVECESLPEGAAYSPAAMLSSPAKAPLPPMRHSSLPPSPTQREASGALQLSCPPSPMRDGEMRQEARAEPRAEPRLRRTSVPLQQQGNGASNSEGEACDGVVRAGSLSPALHPPTDSTGRDQGARPVGAPGPRSCVPGEEGEFAANRQDPSCIQSLVAACYLLACVTQLAGVDLITAFGLLLAMASVFITFAR
ncbi:hypothetical protein GWK47_016948 [Chionoecetes opilio]|uniref:Uncharacterized protein n=1 Tax=Chionoecetes opilio TaxID=41210 RepID=A0A8J4XS44_CHIOP|nr:hypothetical protein GWK47_016948 [Chionoecetes opilio]